MFFCEFNYYGPAMSNLCERLENAIQQRKTVSVGSLINEKWRLLNYLGSGATSDTYLAVLDVGALTNRPIQNPDLVAIKIYKEWVLERKDEVDRLIREFTTLREIDHPNVVKYVELDVDESKGLVYMVMEYLGGKTLSQFVDKNQGDVPFGVIITILRQLCLALHELHRNGVIHRDIKPDNIMILEDKDQLILKLMDFGVIKELKQLPITAEGEFLGTLRYASPEWILGKSDTYAVDIYSIGATLYRVMTKKEPHHYAGTNKASLVLAVLNDSLFDRPDPDIATLRGREEHQFLECLGTWLTSKIPSMRLSTLGELTEIVSSALESRWWSSKISNAEDAYENDIENRAEKIRNDFIDWYADREAEGRLYETAAQNVSNRRIKWSLIGNAVVAYAQALRAEGLETIGGQEEIRQYQAKIEAKIATLEREQASIEKALGWKEIRE